MGGDGFWVDLGGMTGIKGGYGSVTVPGGGSGESEERRNVEYR